MPRFGYTHARGGRLIAAVACLAIGGLCALSGTAMAGKDELKGGSVVIRLQNSRGLKLKPKNLTLPIAGGAVDPIDGSGTVQVSGGFKARRAKGKAKVRITALNLGANGGQGSITAKVAGDFVANFAKLSGGTLARSGFGATISNVRATIAGRGAKALNAAFSPKKRKGASKSAGGGVKAGQPLGTVVSVTTDPRSVEVVPGSGELILHTQALPPGPFVSKLSQHCINPLPGGSPPGVVPIAPAETTDLAGTTYQFPVSGGSASPDFSDGQVITAGGQKITKNSTPFLTPDACATAAPPTGSQLLSTDLGVDFAHNTLVATATLPDGTSPPRAPLASIDFSTGSRSFDQATNTLSVTGATVSLIDIAAPTLNQAFPNESGDPANDFAGGDLIGTIDLTGVKIR
jgi:hypothetical protein